MLRTAILLLVWIGVVAGQVDNDVIPWAFDVVDGSNVTMACNDSSAEEKPMPGDILMWKRVTEKDGERMEVEIMETKKYKFMDANDVDRLHMSVINIDSNDYGLYICSVRNATGHDVIQYQKSLNINGPRNDDLTDKYRIHVIVGAVAAAILFLLLLVGCFVYRFRYKPGKSDRKLELNDTPPFSDKRYVVEDAYYSKDHSASTKNSSNAYDNPVVFENESNGYNNAVLELRERVNSDIK